MAGEKALLIKFRVAPVDTGASGAVRVDDNTEWCTSHTGVAPDRRQHYVICTLAVTDTMSTCNMYGRFVLVIPSQAVSLRNPNRNIQIRVSSAISLSITRQSASPHLTPYHHHLPSTIRLLIANRPSLTVFPWLG
jgi:hypothetical protein